MVIVGNIRDTETWFDWAYKGVDFSLPGNGGIECRDFLSIPQRWLESVAASFAATAAMIHAYPRLRLPQTCSCVYRRKVEPLGKRVLLLLMCMTFGIEIGFKFATRQMIWIGNPCHLVTMIQIYLLAAPPGRIVTAAFRLHMHMLAGAPIAILFPVINTRLLPFEIAVYYIQHILMLVIPFYLMHIGDPFIPEAMGDFNWSLMSFGFLFVYHFIPLQLLAYVSHVNLNNMLCPAVSDPFHGKYYRLFAICHQLILIMIFGKFLVILARAARLLPQGSLPDVAAVCSCQPKCSSCEKLSRHNTPVSALDGFKEDVSYASAVTMNSGKLNNLKDLGCFSVNGSCEKCGRCCVGFNQHKDYSSEHRQLGTYCCGTENFSSGFVVKEHRIEHSKDDEMCSRGWAGDASCCQHRQGLNDAYKNSHKTDAHCGQENGLRSKLETDQEKSRNSHFKSH